jgi:hypothetical protein
MVETRGREEGGGGVADASDMKCGSCQEKRMPARRREGGAMEPVTAVQPMTGGTAPTIAPTHVFHVVVRFMLV